MAVHNGNKISGVRFQDQNCSGPWEPGSRCRLSKARGLLGKPKGGRKFGLGRDWEGFRKGEISLRATWDQGGQDRFTPKEVAK